MKYVMSFSKEELKIIKGVHILINGDKIWS